MNTMNASPANAAGPLPRRHTRRRLVLMASGLTLACALSLLGISLALAPAPRIGPGAVVRHAPDIKGKGRVEGSVRQILTGEDTELVGEDISLSGGATITENLLVPGSPTLNVNGNPTFGGVVQGTGSALPSNYTVKLSGNITLGHLVTRTDPVQLSAVPNPPQTNGTRDVTLTTAGQSAGDFATVRDLTLGGSIGEVSVPPGTYRRLAASGVNTFVLGQTGATAPSVYNLDSLALGDGATLRVAGPVRLNVSKTVSLTTGGKAGDATDALRLAINVAAAGVTTAAVTVAGGSTLSAVVRAPSGQVTIDGNGKLNGTVFCDRLSVNGNSILHGVGDTTPPALNITEPAANLFTKSAQLAVKGTFNDQTDTIVTVNGTPAVMSGNGFAATVTLAEGVNTINVVATDLFGNETTQALSVKLDAQPPAVSVLAPREALVTRQQQITVSGTFQDVSDTTVKVNGVPAVVNGNQFTAAVPLAEGPNTLHITATDSAANTSETLRHVTLDTTPPAVTLAQPSDNLITRETNVTVSGTYSDVTAVVVNVNGVPATLSNGGFTAAVVLNEGRNTINVIAADEAGNETPLTRQATRDTTAPVLSVEQPGEAAYVAAGEVKVTGHVNDVTATTVTVNGVAAVVADGSFAATVPVNEGPNALNISAVDAAGNTTAAQRNVTRDTTAPTLSVAQPADGMLTGDEQLTVSGVFGDANPVTLMVNGTPAAVNGNNFTATVQLPRGQTLLIARAVDAAGNETSVERRVTGVGPLTLRLEQPSEGQLAESGEVRVEGTFSGTDVNVTVNGQPLGTAGGFIFSGYLNLPEGDSDVRVVAADALGRTQEAVRHVKVDTTPPAISDLSPAENQLVAGTTVTVKARVTDSTALVVKVNGTEATPGADGYFSLAGVPVVEGENFVRVTASDALGNNSTAERTFVGKDNTPPAAPVLFPLAARTRLAFQTIEGRAEPGSVVRIAGGTEPAEAEAAFGTGLFFATVKLAEGSNTLSAVAVDRGGNTSPPVAAVVSSEPNMSVPAGQPFQINISTNDTQKALVGQELPRPLIARVTDPSGAPVNNTAVTFTVIYGEGQLVGGARQITVNTNEDGHASARYVGGALSGIQLIRADFANNPSKPADFTAELLEPGPGGQTTASGVVLDQNLRALPNVLVRLGGQQTRTGADGRFVLANVPTGPHQVLELVGREQIQLPGRWPNISYDLDVLPGVDNNLGRPLFLPRVNAGVEMPLDANGVVTADTVYELPAVGGLPPVRVTARAGTHVTFPPDVTDKRLSVTRIPINRTPMSLEEGRATNLYISVQPSGAIFEPALEISFPNLDGLAAQEKVLLMSFDHDAGRYVQVGTGHVSADGRNVTSDAGSGIRMGAWHALPPEPPALEATVLSYVQVEGNPAFEGKDVEVTEASVLGTRAVPYSRESNSSGKLSRVHLRGVVAMPRNAPPRVGTVLSFANAADPVIQIDGGAFDYTKNELFLTEDGEIQITASATGLPGSTFTYTWTPPDADLAALDTTTGPTVKLKGTKDKDKENSTLKLEVVGSLGGKKKIEIKVNLVKVKFKEDKTNSGFDSLVKGKIQDAAHPNRDASNNFLSDTFIDDPKNKDNEKLSPWLTVVLNGDQRAPQAGGTNTAKFEVKPDKAKDYIEFVSDDTSKATVAANMDEKKITVTSQAAGDNIKISAKLSNRAYKSNGQEAGKLNVVVRKRVKVKAAFYFVRDSSGTHTDVDPGSLDKLITRINEILTPQTGIEYQKFRVYHWEARHNYNVPATVVGTPSDVAQDFGDVVSTERNGTNPSEWSVLVRQMCDPDADREIYFTWNVERTDTAPQRNGVDVNLVVAAFNGSSDNTTIIAESADDKEAIAHEIGHSLELRPSNALYYYTNFTRVSTGVTDSAHSNVLRELMFAITNGGSHIPKADVDQAITAVGITNWETGGVKKRSCTPATPTPTPTPSPSPTPSPTPTPTPAPTPTPPPPTPTPTSSPVPTPTSSP
jgi:hypothetical protein